MSDQLLTPADLAERLCIPEKTVMELRRRHNWPHVRLGRAFRFTDEQAAQIVRSQSVTGEKPAAGISGQTELSKRRSA